MSSRSPSSVISLIGVSSFCFYMFRQLLAIIRQHGLLLHIYILRGVKVKMSLIKLNELYIKHTKDVLHLTDNVVTERAIAQRFSVTKSVVGNIKTNRNMIMKAWQENCSSKRKRKLRKTKINLLLFSFRIVSRNVAQLDIAVTGK
jgi:ribosomal protein L35